jgi:hypothetical protein
VLGNEFTETEYPTSTRLYLGGISATSLNAKTCEQLFPTVSQIGFSNVEGLENIVLSSDQMTTHGNGSQKDFFQRLEHVEVRECGDIRTLFPAKWRQALKNIRSVEIDYCESLKEVFELGEADEGINEEKELPLLSSLTELQLSRLPELKCIWKGPTRHVSLQSLIHLKLKSLDKLTFIFTPSLAQSLIHLETLRIGECRELKRLIREKDNDDENNQILSGSDLQSSCFPNLCRLEISRCNKLKSLFPVAMASGLKKLQVLEVKESSQLLEVFGQDDHHQPSIPFSLC